MSAGQKPGTHYDCNPNPSLTPRQAGVQLFLWKWLVSVAAMLGSRGVCFLGQLGHESEEAL